MDMWNTANTIKGIVPGRAWLFYAALRLGTFLMVYFSLVGLTAVTIGGSIMILVGLIPFMVFGAIRVSGKVTEPYRPKEDYK